MKKNTNVPNMVKTFGLATLSVILMGACRGDKDTSSQSQSQSVSADTVRVTEATLVNNYEFCTGVNENGEKKDGCRNFFVEYASDGDASRIKAGDTVVLDNNGRIINHFVCSSKCRE